MTRDETIDFSAAKAIAASPLDFAPDGDDPEPEIAPPGGESFGSLLGGTGKKRKKIPVLILDPEEALAAASEIQIIAAHDFANGNTPEWNEERLIPPITTETDEGTAFTFVETFESPEASAQLAPDDHWDAIPDPVAEAETPPTEALDPASFWALDWSDEPDAQAAECAMPAEVAEPAAEVDAGDVHEAFDAPSAPDPVIEVPGEWDWPHRVELPMAVGEAAFYAAADSLAVPAEPASPDMAEGTASAPSRIASGHRLRAGLSASSEKPESAPATRIATALRRLLFWAWRRWR